jgi:hypothetical protein
MMRHVKEVIKTQDIKNKGNIQPNSIKAIKQELL